MTCRKFAPLVFGVVLGLVLHLGIFAGQLQAAAIQLQDNSGANDNPHNFSYDATHGGVKATDVNDPDAKRICVFCHTPHGASAQSTLWNRSDPADMGSFPIYGRTGEIWIDDIPEAKYPDTEYPNGASKMCMSCHDGASAIGELFTGDVIQMNFATLDDWGASSGNYNSVIDLSLSHPISFVYTETVRSQVDGSSPNSYTLPTDDILDGQDRMQCTTCHDPHLDTNDGSYTLPFWRNYNGSEASDYDDTCAQCHVGGASGTTWGPGIDDHHNLN